VFKSTNAGRSWRIVGGDPHAFGHVAELAVDPRRSSVVYRAIDHGVPASTSGGVFKSTDGGQTWKAMNNGLPSPRVTPSAYAIVIDPRSPNTVYVAADSDGLFPKGIGVFKSSDGGATWVPFSEGLAGDGHRVKHLAIDSRGSTLYAGTYNGVYDRR
jgi:photosystem II stability/assembly factor-like uncharacterized protein